MDRFLGYMPFLLTINGKYQFNWHKVAEAVIIGLVIGVFMWYVGFKQLTIQVEHNQGQICEIKQKLNDMDNKMWELLDKKADKSIKR